MLGIVHSIDEKEDSNSQMSTDGVEILLCKIGTALLGI